MSKSVIAKSLLVAAGLASVSTAHGFRKGRPVCFGFQPEVVITCSVENGNIMLHIERERGCGVGRDATMTLRGEQGEQETFKVFDVLGPTFDRNGAVTISYRLVKGEENPTTVLNNCRRLGR